MFFLFFEHLSRRLLAVEDVGVAGAEHPVDEPDHLGQVKLDAVLENAPVVRAQQVNGRLPRLRPLLLLGLLLLSFLLVVGVSLGGHLLREVHRFLLPSRVPRVERQVYVGLQHRVAFDALADFCDLSLVKTELEKQVLCGFVLAAEETCTLLLEEQLDQHVARFVLHNHQLAVVDPSKVKRRW